MEQVQAAADSIAQIRGLFGNSRIGSLYDNLEPDMRKTLCFAAGLKKHHVGLKLSQLDHIEKVKLHHAINSLEPVIGKLAGHPINDFK
ncbi:hypothetical protein PE36_08336 [Moritella sp. PE36]|uniref:hypothetical protein n=1 Tax=Moritella sp. PE36 TaxID=58051 RepID=UPI0001569DDE|nr:hypothetical protein [Moritella sp. PE36]EDM65053.1 hypothetical protein PE36_08336 [Moritella sp. PE36]